jgi:hypothetical protein
MLTHRRLQMPALVAGLLLLAATSALAYPSLFTQRCASCHSNDTPTCDGCHHHGPSGLSASANAAIYAPGDPVDVTLNGGSQYGWIRAILYDQSDLVLAMATGPTGTGDDSEAGAVTFPVLLNASAPDAEGDYTWEAAWFGGATSGGGSHLEVRRPVSIHVEATTTGVPEGPTSNVRDSTWSNLKSLY